MQVRCLQSVPRLELDCDSLVADEIYTIERSGFDFYGQEWYVLEGKIRTKFTSTNSFTRGWLAKRFEIVNPNYSPDQCGDTDDDV